MNLQCCNCRKDRHGWTGYDQYGCAQCKNRAKAPALAAAVPVAAVATTAVDARAKALLAEEQRLRAEEEQRRRDAEAKVLELQRQLAKAQLEAGKHQAEAKAAKATAEQAASEVEKVQAEKLFRESIASTYPGLFYEVVSVRKLNPDPALADAHQRFCASLPQDLKPQERAVRYVFHTCQPEVVGAIERQGMRPSLCDMCMLRAPWRDHDQGFFGDHTKGVYVSKHADYTFHYQRGREPRAGDEGEVVMLLLVTGRTKYFPSRDDGAQPTPG
mmetsp:Transcript_58731/g.155364  ORF Transcript_58731/g.155364 Transcript_58731/m.155364 type:complete len:272 (-) Transcript_58731:145-960(-)